MTPTITLPRAVVEQALEALTPWMDSDHTVQHAAYHALRAALAQQRLTDAQQEMERSIESLKAALAQQAEPVEPITRLFGTLPVHDAQQAEAAPFGCVTVRRLSLRHENHADQYQFYPAGQSPYLDNVDECHTVYTAPPQRKPLTEEEIDHIDACIDKFTPLREGKRLFARAVERALEEKNRGR